MKTALFFSLLAATSLIAGCADGGVATSTAGAAVNTVCPLMGGKIDGKTTTQWNGQTVGFCCPPCIDEWNGMSDEERVQALAEAEGKQPEEHGDHEAHADHEHHEESSDGEDHEEKVAEPAGTDDVSANEATSAESE